MGADYYAKAVIGVLIDEDKIPKKHVRVKAFQHDFPEDWKVDPTNPSRKLWNEKNYPEFTFDPDYANEDTKLVKLPMGMGVFKGTDDEPAVVGVGAESGSSNGGDDYDFKQIPDSVENVRDALKNILGPLGLWDEKKFGLYSILYCSY